MDITSKLNMIDYCSFLDAPCNKVLQGVDDMKIFLAYPFKDRTRGYIDEICNNKQLNGLTLFPWERLSESAGIIFCKICMQILSSGAFIADITELNQNVLLELGFAIGRHKVPIIIREEGRSQKVLDILQDIKRIEYSDINALCGKIYGAIFEPFPFPEIYDISQIETPILFFINADANMPVKRFIYERLEKFSKEVAYKILIDDASEILGHKLISLLRNVEQSELIVCHMVGSDFNKFNEINAHVSFLAGYALGRKKKLLILQERPADTMIDLQQIRREYNSRNDAMEILNSWLAPLFKEQQQNLEKKKKTNAYVSLQDQLTLALGHPAAEYDTSLSNYFIPTPEFLEARRLRRYLFLGRRGAGKTANFIQLYREFVEQPRTITVRIIPSKLQLAEALDGIQKKIGLNKTTALLEMFWLYVILTEIAISCENYTKKKPYLIEPTLFSDLATLLQKYKIDITPEFDLRFNSCLDQFISSALAGSTADIRAYVLRNFYKDYYAELKRIIQKIAEQHPIIVLVDNLDKDWNAADMMGISSLINALLEVMGKINGQNEVGDCKLITFLRYDIYRLSSRYDPDHDKRQPLSLLWGESILKELICQRISQVPGIEGSAEINSWASVFGLNFPNIGDTFKYVVDRTMYRPRDILLFCTMILDNMNKKRQHVVNEETILESEKTYSESLLRNLRQEYAVGYPDIEDVCLHLFYGKDKKVTESDLKSKVQELIQTSKNLVPNYSIDDIIKFCFDVGVVGIDVKGTKKYSYEGHSYESLRPYAETKGEIQFEIHPGLYQVLDIKY